MSEAMFAGNHGPEGAWSSLKGRMLAPHELPYDTQDQNIGPERLNQQVSGSGSWNSNVIVTTGMTRGGGTLAK